MADHRLYICLDYTANKLLIVVPYPQFFAPQTCFGMLWSYPENLLQPLPSCEWTNKQTHIQTNTHSALYIYIYIYSFCNNSYMHISNMTIPYNAATKHARLQLFWMYCMLYQMLSYVTQITLHTITATRGGYHEHTSSHKAYHSLHRLWMHTRQISQLSTLYTIALRARQVYAYIQLS